MYFDLWSSHDADLREIDDIILWKLTIVYAILFVLAMTYMWYTLTDSIFINTFWATLL